MARKKTSGYSPEQGSLFDDFESSANLEVYLPEVNKPAAKPESMDIDTSALANAPELLFMSFGSGSSGNCAYLGTRSQGILIDAGVDPDTVAAAMKQNGLSMACVKGICVTHDHSDHVRYIYKLVRKRMDVGVFCTPKALNGMLRRHSISRRLKDYHHPIYKEFEFHVAGMTITAFDTSHDGTDNCGFFVQAGEQTFVVATDLGRVTERVDHYVRQAQYVMIEANYDPAMLASGPYPAFLKARIAAERGHLSNIDCASFLGSIYHLGIKNVFLCHLSADNNTPQLALDAVRQGLLAAGCSQVGDASGSLASRQAPLQLFALPRFDSSPLFSLR